MMISAQLGPLRGSSPRGHMQAIPGPLPSTSQPAHKVITVKSTYPRGDKRRGHAQSSKLDFNAPSPIGTRQWALRISNVTPENVKMQAVIRQHGQAAHEPQQEGPPCVKPWPLRKLPEDDVRRDAHPELAELTKESHLNPQHILELWIQRQRASRSPNLTPIRDHGPDNGIEQAPHHGKRLTAHERPMLGTQMGCCTLAILRQPHKSWQHAA